MVNPGPPADAADQTWRWVFGAVVAVVGLLVLLIVFVLTVDHFTEAKDVLAVMGPVAGVIATVVTAFFGIQGMATAGSDATRKIAAAGADATAKLATAHDKAIVAAAYADPARADELTQALGTMP